MDFFVPGRHQTMRLAAYSVSDYDCFRSVLLDGITCCSAMGLVPV